MNIVFISRFSPYGIGGVETHVREVASQLKKRGYTTNIVSDIKYPQIKFLGLLIIWWWFLRNINLIRRADVVHIHDVFIWYLPFRFLLPKKPVYTTFHGYETKFPPSSKAILIRKISEKLSWGNICVGDYIRKWYGTKPTYTIYGGVRILPIPLSGANTTNATNKNNKLKILFIGRLEEDTGITTYLKTLQIIKDKGIDFEFEVCGDGLLKNKAEKWGRVHGFVNDLTPFIGKSDIVFSSSYLSILEALAKKKLVFSSYNNPLKEDYLKMAPFNKWIIIEKSPEKLANDLQYFLVYPNETKKKTKEAYKWIVNQSWEKVVNEYIKVWRIAER